MSEIKVVGITDQRPLGNNLKPMTDAAILNKTLYYKTRLEIHVCPKGAVEAVWFEVDHFKVLFTSNDPDGHSDGLQFILYNAKQIKKDNLPENLKSIFINDDDGIIKFWADDVFYINVSNEKVCSEESSDGSIKVVYKKVQEVE